MTENAAPAPASPAEILDPSGGANQVRVRAYNERLVMSLVRRHGSLSKAEIARRSGLSAQTVTVIMRALEAEGLLMRGAPMRGKVGQPSVPMLLNPDAVYSFGLKIGRRSAHSRRGSSSSPTRNSISTTPNCANCRIAAASVTSCSPQGPMAMPAAR